MMTSEQGTAESGLSVSLIKSDRIYEIAVRMARRRVPRPLLRAQRYCFNPSRPSPITDYGHVFDQFVTLQTSSVGIPVVRANEN